MRSLAGHSFLTALAAALAFAAGCGDDQARSPNGKALAVVATTTQVGDLVRQVGGRRARVEQVLEPNADPHDYEPRPSDAIALGEADLVFSSGGDLDAWLGELIESAGGDARAVELIASVRSRPGEGGTDPHWWHDPRNAQRAVTAIRDAMTTQDPKGAAVYRRNAASYSARLRRLDRAVGRCVARVPVDRRKLVTTHDSLGYYADRYGLDVVGALIPSLSSQAQPSSKDTAALVEQIERLGVPAIFPESSLNPKLERAVAREAGAEVGDALWADTLGAEGSGGATYVESIRSNTLAIVGGLTRGAADCASIAR